MNEFVPHPVEQLHTLALVDNQRQFLLNRGCTIEETRLLAQVYCPFGTRKTYQNVEGIESGQGKGRLFLLAFPDGVTCQEWYFPTGESHLILPHETNDDILLTQRQIDALKLVLQRFITPPEHPVFPVLEESLWQCYHTLLSRFEELHPSQDILTLPMQESEFMLLYVGLATMMAPLRVGLPVEEPLRGALTRLVPVYQHIKPVANLLQAMSFEHVERDRAKGMGNEQEGTTSHE